MAQNNSTCYKQPQPPACDALQEFAADVAMQIAANPSVAGLGLHATNALLFGRVFVLKLPDPRVLQGLVACVRARARDHELH